MEASFNTSARTGWWRGRLRAIGAEAGADGGTRGPREGGGGGGADAIWGASARRHAVSGVVSARAGSRGGWSTTRDHRRTASDSQPTAATRLDHIRRRSCTATLPAPTGGKWGGLDGARRSTNGSPHTRLIIHRGDPLARSRPKWGTSPEWGWEKEKKKQALHHNHTAIDGKRRGRV